MQATDSNSIPPLAGSQRWLYLASGMLLGALFLYLAARNIELGEAIAALGSIEARWVLMTLGVYVLIAAVRIIRWRFMFADQDRPGLRYAADAFFLGKLGNNLLPGRMGELLRAAALGRLLPQVGFSGTIATIVIEKAFDALVLAGIIGLCLFIAPLPDWLRGMGVVIPVVFTLLLLALVAVDRGHQRLDALLASEPGGLLGRLLGLLRGMLRKFTTGLHALRQARHLAAIAVLSVLAWSLECLIIYLCIQALGLDLPAGAALVTLAFLYTGSLMPTAPGFIGTYQLFTVAAMTLYGVDETSAFALGVFLNLCVMFFYTLTGVITLVM